MNHRVGASATAKRSASFGLASYAFPVSAMSNVVPRPAARAHERPLVMFTPASSPRTFAGPWPWSWHIASTTTKKSPGAPVAARYPLQR